MEKIGAASEKYQSRTKTAPARGSAEAATTRQRGGLLVGLPKSPTGRRAYS